MYDPEVLLLDLYYKELRGSQINNCTMLTVCTRINRSLKWDEHFYWTFYWRIRNNPISPRQYSVHLTFWVAPCDQWTLKALSLNHKFPKLLEIRRSNPHLLESAHTTHDGCTNPCRETSIWRSCDLDGSSYGNPWFQLFHEPFFKARK